MTQSARLMRRTSHQPRSLRSAPSFQRSGAQIRAPRTHRRMTLADTPFTRKVLRSSNYDASPGEATRNARACGPRTAMVRMPSGKQATNALDDEADLIFHANAAGRKRAAERSRKPAVDQKLVDGREVARVPDDPDAIERIAQARQGPPSA